jgi:hypothetical protein
MAVSLRSALVPAGLFLIALSSCSSSSGGTAAAPVDTSRQVFTGAVADTDARIAFVKVGPQALAYVCGGPSTFMTLSRWFDLAATSNGAYSATAAGHVLTATFDGTTFKGTLVTPDGVSHAVESHPKVAGTQTDLLGAVDDGCHAGLILEQQGTEEPQTQGTWCSSKGLSIQVTPAHPIRLVNQALDVVITTPDGDRKVTLSPVTSFE